ncbi:MAG: FkbM family methyltransferase [Flavobacteriales bacterium]
MQKHTEWLEFKNTLEVSTMKLIDFCSSKLNISNIDFIHMDVQGAELMVLKEALKHSFKKYLQYG